MNFLKWLKKQNRLIRYGNYSLAIALVVLALALILIGTANFVPKDANIVNSDLIGSGFQVMVNHNISEFLSSQGVSAWSQLYTQIFDFSSAPLAQLIAGIVFLVIVLPIFGGFAILLLASGYFKRWLYT